MSILQWFRTKKEPLRPSGRVCATCNFYVVSGGSQGVYHGRCVEGQEQDPEGEGWYGFDYNLTKFTTDPDTCDEWAIRWDCKQIYSDDEYLIYKKGEDKPGLLDATTGATIEFDQLAIKDTLTIHGIMSSLAFVDKEGKIKVSHTLVTDLTQGTVLLDSLQ